VGNTKSRKRCLTLLYLPPSTTAGVCNWRANYRVIQGDDYTPDGFLASMPQSHFRPLVRHLAQFHSRWLNRWPGLRPFLTSILLLLTVMVCQWSVEKPTASRRALTTAKTAAKHRVTALQKAMTMSTILALARTLKTCTRRPLLLQPFASLLRVTWTPPPRRLTERSILA